MSRVPDTRASLILRLPRAEDGVAWREFAAIYEPFVYRFGRRGGLQDADARDLVQAVLASVAKAVERWRFDDQRARFRTWLFKIARNHLLDALAKRQRQPLASGSSSIFELIAQQAADEDATAERVHLEHRRELFRFAAAKVKQVVTESTWRAFWKTAIEQESVAQVAAELKLSVGAVYIARSRVLERLRHEVEQLENDDAL